MGDCKIVAITNQKGGVGKTTTTVNLGVGLAKQGKRVLLVDADPQGSLTVALGVKDPDSLAASLATAMNATIEGAPVALNAGIIQNAEGVDLLPSNIELSGMETALFNTMSRETVLVEWGITEAQALQICYDRGYDWNGLYEIYHRCSCWCCPFQRIDELRKLRHHHPELWQRLIDLDRRAIAQFGENPLGKFKQNWTVEQLEQRFATEDRQIAVFDCPDKKGA